VNLSKPVLQFGTGFCFLCSSKKKVKTRSMAFDSEEWASSFYGVVDERFAVETDLLQLHIYRKKTLEKLNLSGCWASLTFSFL
jgi:hypothetical protein